MSRLEMRPPRDRSPWPVRLSSSHDATAPIAAISTHIGLHIGAVHTVFDEIVSDDLHLRIHYVKSSWFRRHEVLVTSGMSARPMAVPEGSEQPRFAEIVTVLPRGWPLTLEAFSDERHYWPIRLMTDVARYMHHAGTWIGFGHTVASAVLDRFDTHRVTDRIDPARASVV